MGWPKVSRRNKHIFEHLWWLQRACSNCCLLYPETLEFSESYASVFTHILYWIPVHIEDMTWPRKHMPYMFTGPCQSNMFSSLPVLVFFWAWRLQMVSANCRAGSWHQSDFKGYLQVLTYPWSSFIWSCMFSLYIEQLNHLAWTYVVLMV